MKTHILKTDAVLFDRIKTGDKNFEIRKNDRFYQAGDTVILQRVEPEKPAFPPQQMPGVFPKAIQPSDPEEMRFNIGFVLEANVAQTYGIQPGYCAFSLLQIPAFSTTDKPRFVREISAPAVDPVTE